MLNFLKRKSSKRNQTAVGGLPPVAQIGLTAGDVWGLLADNGESDIDRLVELSEGSRDEILLALGWLAREGKVSFTGTHVALVSGEAVRAA